MCQQSWQPANLSPNAEDNKALQRHTFVFFVISRTMTSQGRSENSDQSGPLHPMLPNADHFKVDSSSESAYSSTFHKAIEFSLKKLGKPKLELRREQYDAIRAICFERKDALAVLPTGFRKSLIYREFLTTFEAAVSLNVIILLCLLCHPEAGL